MSGFTPRSARVAGKTAPPSPTRGTTEFLARYEAPPAGSLR